MLNPILFQKGIRSLLGVPLLAHGDLVGVMHVGTMAPRRFTNDEVELLQVVADRVALAVHVRLSDRARVVIDAFQRTFLPDVLPFIPGLRIATRYLPAASAVGVGGDWFDTFMLPRGELALVIGDVAGHGLPAASLMGRMRNAVRAHALMGGTPRDIVARADAFHRHFGEGELMTLLVGIVPRDLATLRFVSAGHPPPLVVGPTGATFSSSDPPNAPLGLPGPSSFVEEVVTIGPGTSVLLYTDGLLERRGESLGVGFERLRSNAEGVIRGDALHDEIGALVQRLLGAARPVDDVAMMVISREATAPSELEFSIDARARSLTVVRRALSRWLEDLRVPDRVARDVVLAASEACSNVVEHAYGPAGGMALVTARLEEDEVRVTIRDSGGWRGASSPDRGNGLRLIRAMVDDVQVATSDGGTTVDIRRSTAV